MILIKLLIAHLLGDFVFQSNDLILKRYKSWRGTFEHACIIGFFTTLALFPYWSAPETWQVIVTIVLVHFLQDCLKVAYDIHLNKNKSTLPFFLDQIFHVSLIFALTPLVPLAKQMDLPDSIQYFYESQELSVYLMGLILFSYAYDITVYQFKRRKAKKPIEYIPDYEEMLKRIIIFSIVYALFLLSRYGLM